MRTSFRPLTAVLMLAFASVPLAAKTSSSAKTKSTVANQLTKANRLATLGPAQGAFVNATEFYPWSEGAIFRLYTSPGRVSDIALEPGEALVSVAAGDTVRWIVGTSNSGSAETRREHILVKPTAAGLSTNLLILTDRRSYHLEVISTPAGAMASISWSYPKDRLLSLSMPPVDPVVQKQAEPAKEPDLTVLRFGYDITGDAVSWRPIGAFDDGRHVYIEFPADIEAGSAPPLFVTDGKAAELVNYRMQGRYYIVDRLFATAELRLGDKPQHVVRIMRTTSEHGS